MLQTRQTAVFLHFLSSLVQSLRLIACLIPSLIPCRFSTSLSPQFSNSLRPFIKFTRFPMMSSICSSFSRFLFSSFIHVRKGISRWTPQRVSVLDLHSTLSISFSTTPLNYFLSSNSSTERHYTPQSDTAQFDPFAFLVFFCSSSTVQLHSALRAFAVDQKVTFSAALLQTRQTVVFLHFLSS
jgi:hypothetical protein